MDNHDLLSTTNKNLSISVIIPVFNDWRFIEFCIDSIISQRILPKEIIVIDDGSTVRPSHRQIEFFNKKYVTLISIQHGGVSAARNYGLLNAKGDIVLFLDSDCYLDYSATEELIRFSKYHLDKTSYQLKICGDVSTIVGAAEEIYNTSIQDVMVRLDGTIQWLCTSGFAINRKFGIDLMPLFDERAQRGQDTLLLGKLIKLNCHPSYVPNSVVFHSPQLTSLEYIAKAYKSCILSKKAYKLLSEMEINIKVNRQQWISLIKLISYKALVTQRGRIALLVLVLRHIAKILAKISQSY